MSVSPHVPCASHGAGCWSSLPQRCWLVSCQRSCWRNGQWHLTPWTHWQTNALRLQEDGLTAALHDVVVRRTPTHYDLSGALDLQASTYATASQVCPPRPRGLQCK